MNYRKVEHYLQNAETHMLNTRRLISNGGDRDDIRVSYHYGTAALKDAWKFMGDESQRLNSHVMYIFAKCGDNPTLTSIEDVIFEIQMLQKSIQDISYDLVMEAA